MAKAFSVASWNIEHFGAVDSRTREPKKPVQPIIDFLAGQNADVVAIYEVTGKHVFRGVIDTLSGYQFHITEGPQIQEILIGVRNGISAFVTQKLKFKSGQSTLRPGVLVTLTVDGEPYPLLFLHLKSMPDPKGFGLRDDMLQRALRFRSVLNKATTHGRANYIFLGDLNTMGFDFPYKKYDIPAGHELHNLDRGAKYHDMRRLSKTSELTWWNGKQKYKPGSSLDHVMAAQHIGFKLIEGAEVAVRGWPERSTDAQKRDWIENFSDHGLLYFEVQKV